MAHIVPDVPASLVAKQGSHVLGDPGRERLLDYGVTKDLVEDLEDQATFPIQLHDGSG